MHYRSLGSLAGLGRTWHTGSMIGLHCEKRPGDSMANALHVAPLATGEAEETYVNTAKHRGGKAPAARLTAKERHQIAKDAASARRSA